MVIVFDLDDTLYEERDYVLSGFRAVAAFGERQLRRDADASFRFMTEALDRNGRGAIFDLWLASFGKRSKGLVRECVRVYRHHKPHIRTYDEAQKLLPRLAKYPLYLLTDGHKVVQQKKLDALGIRHAFRHVYITHRYGICHAKPSIHCFERLREREGCDWRQMIYVGDNPAKDFVNLNPLSVHTVRVHTGHHKDLKASAGHDARHAIRGLGEFESLLERIEQ